MNPLSVSECPNNAYILSPYKGNDEDMSLADLIHPLLEISKKRDVRSVTASIDQYVKRLNELIDMNKSPIPNDEIHQRQKVRVQDYQKNSLKSVCMQNKFTKKVNYMEFLKEEMDRTPSRVSRNSRATFATMVNSKKMGLPLENSIFAQNSSKMKSGTREDNESADDNYGPEIVSPKHGSPMKMPGDKVNFYLECTQNGESKKVKMKKAGSDIRLEALVSIRNLPTPSKADRSVSEQPRETVRQGSIHIEAENYVQTQAELDQLPKELLSMDQRNYLFKGYYTKINQQNEATRLKAGLLDFVNKL